MPARIRAFAFPALALWLAGCGGCDKGAGRGASADFELKDLAGRTVKLGDFRGKVVLLDFWAAYCGPCRDSIPEFQRLHERLSGEGLEVVGISMDAVAKDAADFVREFKMTYTVLLDPENRTKTPFGVRGLPSTLLLDRSGAVRRKWIGYGRSVHKEIRDEVMTLLKEERR